MLNHKALAWDKIGNLFWEKGRTSAKPSAYEMELFTRDIQPGDRVCVIGASTKELVCLLMDKSAQITVYDFSQGMCQSLREAVPDATVAIETLDIVAPLDANLIGSQDYVLNDRLINRFTASEAESALKNMCALAQNGEVRASIKLGFYPMDEKMIALGKERGTLSDFFDENTSTIDFSKAGTVLNESILAHGEIDRELLLEWYRGRAAEKRFEHAEIEALADQIVLPNGNRIQVTGVYDFPDAINTNLYNFRAW
ncbi:class I SAM-dependent methyltransferase [Thalassospira povalilytica]|uniref:hypothetical protein n=1 Tax=Thalassospira povalilytica TaxID=732237 RepID=UPI001D18D717|nr:hypothetical protein [Thalassospira povalilytica]MCC4242081.1 hypothetical protein [Thalassospira povalilytica]